jgi:DNA-binding transcriptional regulator YiaG
LGVYLASDKTYVKGVKMSFFSNQVLTGVRVKNLRDHFKESQEKFAKRLGVSLYTVWRWENFKCEPSFMALEKLDSLEKSLADK